jgi:hypothetical protein
MDTRPAYFNILDASLISAGYDPEDIDEVLWDSKAPKILRVKLKRGIALGETWPHSQLIFLEITSHSLVVEHKGPHATRPSSQATHSLVPEKTKAPQ